jgi:predicted RNA methylase
MRTSRRKIEELLWILGLHAPARSVYAATLGREVAAAKEKMKEFYGSVVRRGDVVFDVGANVGVVSSIFVSLGARVVAVEPNPDCVRHIELSYADKDINIIQAAIGATNGLGV